MRTFVVHICEEIVWSTGSLCTIRHMLDDIQLVNSLLALRRCDDTTMYHNVVANTLPLPTLFCISCSAMEIYM